MTICEFCRHLELYDPVRKTVRCRKRGLVRGTVRECKFFTPAEEYFEGPWSPDIEKMLEEFEQEGLIRIVRLGREGEKSEERGEK